MKISLRFMGNWNAKKIAICILMIAGAGFYSFGQRFEWTADAYTFMDNQSFGGSPYSTRTIMSGFRISPEIGLSWDEGQHRIMIGSHLMKEFGTTNYLDRINFTGYYEYKKKGGNLRNHLLFGAFPREGLLDNYSGLFFCDSIRYYRPNLNGIFWQLGGRNNHINIWVDWVGAQSSTQRESFLIGLSGEQRWKWLFVDLQSYSYFYYLYPILNEVPTAILEQDLQAKASVGVDFSKSFKHLNKLRFSVGAMGGIQKTAKNFSSTYYPIGLVLDLNAEFWYVGTRTTYYYGKPVLRNETPGIIQWSNPFLYGNHYLETEWYIPFFRNDLLTAEASATFHITDNKCFFQQQISLKVNLDRDKLPLKRHFKKKHRPEPPKDGPHPQEPPKAL